MVIFLLFVTTSNISCFQFSKLSMFIQLFPGSSTNKKMGFAFHCISDIEKAIALKSGLHRGVKPTPHHPNQRLRILFKSYNTFVLTLSPKIYNKHKGKLLKKFLLRATSLLRKKQYQQLLFYPKKYPPSTYLTIKPKRFCHIFLTTRLR